MFQKTTALSKIAQLKKRIRIVQGGTSSSKTFSILPLLIDYAIKNPNSEISVVSESIPHLRRGAIKDFVKIMIWTNNWIESNFNKSNLVYRFSNNSFIEFFSVEQPDKLRGARRDILFINECNNVPFEAYQQLAIRTKKFIYLDYNPSHEFWVHTELQNDPDTNLIVLTYKDNEALDPAIVKEIEKAREKAETSAYWSNWWRVYGLGQLGVMDNLIFNDWKQIDMIPKEAKLLGHGIDFGYTNDPSTCISLYKINETFIAHEQMYRKGASNRDIYNQLKDLQGYFIADSAEPKSIAELRSYGMSVLDAEKGQGSVLHGIQSLQSIDLKVTSSSLNLIKELRNYTWMKDKSGAVLNQPIDAYNHCIDALRYVGQKHILKKGSGKYRIR